VFLLSDDDGMMQWMASDFCDKHKHNTHTKGTKRLLEWQLWSDAMMIASNIYRQTQNQHIKRRLKEKKLNHLHMMHWVFNHLHVMHWVFVEKTQTQHTHGDFKRGRELTWGKNCGSHCHNVLLSNLRTNEEIAPCGGIWGIVNFRVEGY